MGRGPWLFFKQIFNQDHGNLSIFLTLLFNFHKPQKDLFRHKARIMYVSFQGLSVKDSPQKQEGNINDYNEGIKGNQDNFKNCLSPCPKAQDSYWSTRKAFSKLCSEKHHCFLFGMARVSVSSAVWPIN